MAQELTTELIDRQEWLDPLADTLQQAVGQAYESAGEAGRAIQNFLHGTWLGHPLHSAVTDVPIGAWTSALVMDAMEDVTGRREFGTAADTAVAIGLVGAIAAAATGVTDWHKIDGQARKIGLAHGLLNLGGALLCGASLAARKNGARSAGRGLSTLGFVVVMGSAWLGGKLTYSEKIGVDHTAGLQFPEHFTPVLPESELPEGEMRKTDAAGTPVLLANRGGHIFALSNVCSHLGGPLNEGKLEDCSVVCPWHGSRFSLEDGRVLDGPATHPAPCLDVRARNGQIEVRRK